MEAQSKESITTSQSPNFHHQEIEWLYTHGLYISEEKLNTILSLPRKTLIQDLEVVLKDSIERCAYFDNLSEENWDETKTAFLLHSLFILGELNAKESVDAIFNVLSQSSNYIDLYLGDFLTELMWEILYKILKDDLEACKQFMLKSGDENTIARSIIPDVINQIAFHTPERRDEAITWYSDVIQFFLDNNSKKIETDIELIGYLICDLIEIEARELLSDIEKLFERRMVSIWICGDWDEVKADFNKTDDLNYKKQILPIAERYKKITSTWASYNKQESKPRDGFDYYEPDTSYISPADLLFPKPVRTGPKVGRNEPCPCGSGKKYKKCCLGK